MTGYKIDLHTHSMASPDGGIPDKTYAYFLEHNLLSVVAVTDHGRIDRAKQLQQDLGDRIIVGEEVKTSDGGELIGLYLSEAIPEGLRMMEAIKRIKRQGGIVYVPHPFETVRSGVTPENLSEIARQVDIIEGYNGRAVFQNRGRQAREWAAKNNVSIAASSDAHGRFGWGKTYSIVDELPTQETLVPLLRSSAYSTGTVGVGILYPSLNRVRHKIMKGRK